MGLIAEYKNNKVYKKGDVTKFEGKYYKCTPPWQPRKGYFEIANRNPPTDTKYWTELTKEEILTK